MVVNADTHHVFAELHILAQLNDRIDHSVLLALEVSQLLANSYIVQDDVVYPEPMYYPFLYIIHNRCFG